MSGETYFGKPVTHNLSSYSYSKTKWDALISQIYFCNRTLHVSDRSSVYRQETSTVYTALGICYTCYADCLLASSQHNLYDIHLLLCIQY